MLGSAPPEPAAAHPTVVERAAAEQLTLDLLPRLRLQGRQLARLLSERIALPSGARVVSMTAAGDRLVIHVETQGGPSAAYVVDPRNGALLGTVEFPPGAGR